MKAIDLGSNRVLSTVLKLVIPAMIAQFINVLYSIVDRIYVGNIEGIGDFDIFGDARVVLAGLDAGDDGLVGVHHEGKPLLGKVLGNAMRPDLLTKRVNAGLHLFLFVVHGAKSTLMTNQS